MRIPRYRTYWTASGLWAVRNLRGWALLAAIFVGIPLAFMVESGPWRAAAVAAALGLGLAIALWERR